MSGATQKRAKRAERRHSIKAAADTATIVAKRRWRLINLDKESFRRSHAIREKRHLGIKLQKGSGRVSLVKVLLNFLSTAFVTRIAQDIPTSTLKYECF